jgi:ABC-2 type transport system permease protein
MTTATTPVDPTTRRVPPLGGLNTTLVRIEQKRMLRNRRTIVFARVFATTMFFVFGSGGDSQEGVGGGNVSAYVMVDGHVRGRPHRSLRGGRSGGRARPRLVPPAAPDPAQPHGLHRRQGLRIARHGPASRPSPSTSSASCRGKPQMPADVWVKCGLLTRACVMTFAALGVFVGYLVPGKNVMQVLGPGLALLAFLGGLFIPLSTYSPLVRDIAY